MIPAQFDDVRPADLDEALKILTEREEKRSSSPAATA